jgi:O-methyltransferase
MTNVIDSENLTTLHSIDNGTAKLSRLKSPMKSSLLQGNLLSLLVKLIGARKILEIGTFTGYTATAMASALPDDSHSKLITYDIDPNVVKIGENAWKGTPLESKIETRIGNVLQDFVEGKFQPESIDIVFIDANKKQYADYWDMALSILRPGGLIIVDNTLWSGTVITPNLIIPCAREINNFNIKAKNDSRVDTLMLPLFDGLTIARKKTSSIQSGGMSQKS